VAQPVVPAPATTIPTGCRSRGQEQLPLVGFSTSAANGKIQQRRLQAMMPKRQTKVRLWETDGEGIIYNPISGMGHVLNYTALQIWTLCDGNHNPEDIAGALACQFPEHREQIKHDVIETLNRLDELGLLDRVST
jgi:hypothetical protein